MNASATTPITNVLYGPWHPKLQPQKERRTPTPRSGTTVENLIPAETVGELINRFGREDS